MMIAHSAGTEATAQTCCGRNCDSIPNMQADEQEATTGIPTPKMRGKQRARLKRWDFPVGKSGALLTSWVGPSRCGGPAPSDSAGLYDPAPNAYSHVARLEPGVRLVYLAGQGGEYVEGTPVRSSPKRHYRKEYLHEHDHD